MRFNSAQGLAGSWTAAVTKDILDINTLGLGLLPRCNMDESFATNLMVQQPDNSVLRIFRVDSQVLAVSRTYWVTDILTETQGRKAAYTVTHLFRGEDMVRFVKSYYWNAFDPSFFEPYPSAARRIAEVGVRRFEVDDSFDLLSRPAPLPHFEDLEEAGVTRNHFLAMMQAVFSGQKLAVILPLSQQKDWVNNGIDHGSELAQALLALFPYWMRLLLGVATAWSCRLGNEMTAGLDIAFAYHEPREHTKELVLDMGKLRDANCAVVDLNADCAAPALQSRYLDFLWESRNDPSAREAFWRYCEDELKLLDAPKGLRTPLPAMELAFHLYENVTGRRNIGTEESVQYYSLCTTHLQGIQSEEIERFLTVFTEQFRDLPAPLPDQLVKSLREQISAAWQPSSRQVSEYRLLLREILSGGDSEENIDVMGNELKKSDRNAASLFADLLRENLRSDDFPGGNPVGLTNWIFGLYAQYLEDPAVQDSLRGVISDLVLSWVRSTYPKDPVEDKQHLSLLLSCMRTLLNGQDSTEDGIFYREALHWEMLAKEKATREWCAKYNSEVEEKLRSGELSVPAGVPSLFFSEFRRNCRRATLSPELLERFYRFALESDSLLEEAFAIYQEMRDCFPAEHTAIRAGCFAEAVFPRGRKAALLFEQQDMAADPRYVPSPAVLDKTLQTLGSEDPALFRELYLPLLSRMNEEERTGFLDAVTRVNPADSPCGIEAVYFHALAVGDDRLFAAAQKRAQAGDLASVTNLFERHIAAEPDELLRQKYQNYFLEQFQNGLKKNIDEAAQKAALGLGPLCSYLREKRGNVERAGQGSPNLSQICLELVDERWLAILERELSDRLLLASSAEELQQAEQLLQQLGRAESDPLRKKIRAIYETDRVTPENAQEFCRLAGGSSLAGIAADRLYSHLTSFPEREQLLYSAVIDILRGPGSEVYKETINRLKKDFDDLIRNLFDLRWLSRKYLSDYAPEICSKVDEHLKRFASSSKDKFDSKEIRDAFAIMQKEDHFGAEEVRRNLLRSKIVLVKKDRGNFENFGTPMTILLCVLAALVTVLLLFGYVSLVISLAAVSATKAIIVAVVGIVLAAVLGITAFLLLSGRI